ncbi:MAG: hypothetical protein EA339_05545 [Rhodobacteraceae bacterium]|nr:MAG: hypothetical protein EA339_05545 [Paracoccaceae bacterium]
MVTQHADASDPTQGKGFYPSFHALWHLETLRVIDNTQDFASCAWEKAAQAATPDRIAIMDTTVDWEHPNLNGAIDTANMQDFSSLNSGDLVDTKTGPTIYGAHGTAVAGLIGARPVRADLLRPERVGLTSIDECGTKKEIALPYAGINPFCQMIPVSLSAAPDPDMVLGALDYIDKLRDKPQIIVVAAAWDDTIRVAEDAPSFDPSEGRWSAVTERLRQICETTLVLCAAGNSGAHALSYPASLAGSFPGLVAVTACDIDGKPLTYAYHPKPGDTSVIATLSTQASRYDRDLAFLDPWAEVDPYLKRPDPAQHFPKQRIISLDPRGRRGYNPSIYRYTPPADGPHLEIASLFAEFSGTSAATAIAAGLISLAMQSEGKSVRPALKKDAFAGIRGLFDLDAARRVF